MTRLAKVLRIIQVVSLKERDIEVTHCPSTRAYFVKITRLGKAALYCYSEITVVLGCIPSSSGVRKWCVEGRKITNISVT